MDWVNRKESLADWFRRSCPMIVAAALGVLLMFLPTNKESVTVPVQDPEPQEETLEDSLARTLSFIDGVGEMDVLLTEETGTQTIYQWDEDISAGNTRRETVILSGDSRQELGLVQQILPPTYRGAVVICQGAEDASVRLAIVEAVKSVTGLSSDRITVLKRK